MVTRKPVAPKPGVQQSSNAQIYPVARKPADGTDSRLSSFGTMSDASSSLESPAFEVRNMHDGHRVSPHGLGGIEMNDPWAEETVERTHAQNRLPAALRIGKGNSTVEKNMEQETVPSLRMGLSEGHPATSEDARRPYNPASQSVWQAGAIANKQQQTPYTPQHPANTFSRNSSTTASVDQHIDKEEQSSAGVWNESAESMPTPPRGSRSPQVDDRTEGASM